MKILAAILLALPLSSFAVSDCKTFSVSGNDTAYQGEITEESRTISFGNCPDSVLVNKSFVARLLKLHTVKGEETCLYATNKVVFYCSK